MRMIAMGAAVAATLFGASASALTATPSLIRQVAPDYPRAAERRAIDGYVVVSFDVEADGKTSNILVTQSQPEGVFDRSATAALAKWRFEAGAPAEGLVRRINFKAVAD